MKMNTTTDTSIPLAEQILKAAETRRRIIVELQHLEGDHLRAAQSQQPVPACLGGLIEKLTIYKEAVENWLGDGHE